MSNLIKKILESPSKNKEYSRRLTKFAVLIKDDISNVISPEYSLWGILCEKYTVPVVLEYIRFLCIKIVTNDKYRVLGPSEAVHEVWKYHMMIPSHYVKTCMKLTEKIIDHYPDRSGIYSYAKKMYAAITGSPPDSKLWPGDEEYSFLEPGTDGQIFVKTRTEKILTIDIDKNDATEDLKFRIFMKCSVPPDAQRIIYSGKQLEDDKKIVDDYNLTNESTVHLVLRLTGC